MKKALIKHQVRLHIKILKLRSIETLINSKRFERLWDDSKWDKRKEAIRSIKAGNKLGIMKWMKTHQSLELGEKNVTILKNIAAKLGIKNYSRMSKSVLIREINHAEKKETGVDS